LSEISNATGYVTFQNATAGTYTFSIVKLGYPTQNETVDYNALPLTLNIALTGTASNVSNSGNALVVIVVVVVIVAVVAVVVGFFIKKRVVSPNVKKLQQLKKQMKPKFQT
jgi:hypothetical protein